jgi:hypothetical protein
LSGGTMKVRPERLSTTSIAVSSAIVVSLQAIADANLFSADGVKLPR